MGVEVMLDEPVETRRLDELLTSFESLTKNPEGFLSQGVRSEFSKNLIKSIFDWSMKIEKNPKNPLWELIVSNFDDEQIWQQLELHNARIKKFIPSIVNFVTSDNLAFPVDIEGVEKEQESESEIEDVVSQEEESDLASEDDSEFQENYIEEEDQSDEDLEAGDRDDSVQAEEEDTKLTNSSEGVDDKFFNLSKMTAFLDNEDKKGEKSDDVWNYFEDLGSGSEDENAMYKDFFKEPGGFDESDQLGNKKTVKFELDEDEVSENSTDNEEDEYDHGPKSSLEQRKERLKKKIEDLEESALEPKPWQLAGEVTATSRPVNSLLEEFVEFDVAQRPAPVITEQTTLQLEDIIKKLIKDKAFDDVERKIKPVTTPHEYKNKLVLDQEKSKLSLAEIYENEYIKQKGSVTNEDKPEEEPEEHKEIKRRKAALFSKLDALSNYFFTPKLKPPELKIVNNMPAISLEEVGPEATADARLLAPEEITGEVKKSLLGKDERTKSDKNRERKKKKQHQAVKFKIKEKSSLGSKELGDIKLLKHRKQISKLQNETAVVKSSKEFFSRLQDTTETGWKRKKTVRNPKEAKKLKM